MSMSDHAISQIPSLHFLSAGKSVASTQRTLLARAIAAHRSTIAAAWLRNQLDPALVARYQVEGLDGGGHDSIARLFVTPLLDLLIAYIRTGESCYRDVYLDERLRYAPFRASPAIRAAFFAELLPKDERALLVVLREDLHEPLREMLADLHSSLLVPADGPAVRVLALGDCLLGELRVFLAATSRRDGITVDVRNLYFSAVTNRSLDAKEALDFVRSTPLDLVALSFLTYEGIPAYRALMHDSRALSERELDERVEAVVGLIRAFLTALREASEAPFLLHGVSGLPLTRWRGRLPFLSPLSSGRRRALSRLNAKIRELASHTENTIFIDEAAIAETAGLRACEEPVIPRRVVRRAFFHTSRFGEILSREYAGIIRAYSRLRRVKVLLVDFDDTLWRGVMADGPVEHYRERQELLLRLKDAGIVLVAVSKNDPANIRWEEMLLKAADFAVLKISWNMKVDAIREAAHELDLGLDSMVLIDDNPVERALVQENLRGVQALDGRDEGTWAELRHMLQFPNTKTTEEARTRTAMYQQQVARRALLAKPMDVEAMLDGLGLNAEVRRARRGDLDRIAELVQRTNQFNTTTIRYSKQELEALLANEAYRVYVSSLSDKFGKLGLVAVAIVERRGDVAIFDSFVMSCRAMGFQLERLMIGMVLEEERDAAAFVGRFRQTDRNLPARGLFADCGFREFSEGEWRLEGDMPRPVRPSWFALTA